MMHGKCLSFSYFSTSCEAWCWLPFVLEYLHESLNNKPCKTVIVFLSRANGRFAYSIGTERWWLPLEQQVGMLHAHFKRFQFSKIRISLLQCLISHPMRFRSKGTDTNILVLMLTAMLWVIHFFVSNTRLLCIRPACMKLWQVNLTACKGVKIRPFSFW